MEALNAVGLKPISVLKAGPKKHSSFPTNSYLKISSLSPKSHFHGSLVLISSVFNSAFAKALTYEEALGQSTTASDSSFSTPGFDVSGFIDSIVNFGVENPAVVVGGAVVLAVPIILSQVLGKAKPWGVESARNAFEKLGDDGSAQLLDIRAPGDIKQVGSPDIRGLKKKPISIAYNGEDKPGFLKKLALKFKEPENTTLFILDKFDGNSELVAELVTVNGFKAAYAIKDGAEGPRGWMNSGLPWILPKKSFSVDFSSLTDAIDGALGEGSDAASLVLSIAAATGLGLLAFSEIETILELLGSAALIQLVTKKFLFAEDRKRTLKEVDEFLTTKVAPKELVDELKQIGQALLPSPVTSKALPAPAVASQEEAITDSNNSTPPTVQAETATSPEPTPQVNSVPKAEAEEESSPKPPQPLSPYPYYPNLKPPTSPTPSTP